MFLKPLRIDLISYLKKRSLMRKWIKASTLFVQNHKYPSLHFELLQPKWRGLYSSRIDKKYRALCFIARDETMEVFQITNHYKK